MTLSSFAARGGLSLSEIARINAEEGLRFPSAENPLADYPTHESLVYTSKNTSGFSLVQLRLMCTQRGLLPQGGTNNARSYTTALLKWRESVKAK